MKKTIAMLLVLALTLASMSVSAFAALPPNQAEGEGTVNFTEGDGPIIIPDPESTNYNVRGIDFGSHSLDDNTTTRTYDSLLAGRGDGKTTGITIKNTFKTGWRVTVIRTGFAIGTTPVMADAVLTLIPMPDNKPSFPNPKPFDGALGAPTFPGSNPVISTTAAAPVLSAAATNGIGIWSGLWSGTLLVPANQADLGDAKSTMIWTVEVGP